MTNFAGQMSVAFGLFLTGGLGVNLYFQLRNDRNPGKIPNREKCALCSVIAIASKTRKQSVEERRLNSRLYLKLCNSGFVAYLTPIEMRHAYQATGIAKSDLLFRLGDTAAWAEPRTIRGYKETLFYIRQFRNKFDEGTYHGRII